MNRTKIVGLVLIAALYLGFFYFSSKEQAKYNEQKVAYEAQIAQLEAQNVKAVAEVVSQDAPAVEDIKAKSIEEVGEVLTEARMAKSQGVVIENDVMRVDFDTRGAKVSCVTLKDYTKYAPKGERTELVKMFDPTSAKMDLQFYIRNGYNNLLVNTSDYVFEAQPVVELGDATQLTMRLYLEAESYLDYVYTIYNSNIASRDYLVDFKIQMHNMAAVLANQSSVVLDVANKSYQNERGFTNENTYTTVAYHHAGERAVEELKMSKERESKQISTSVDWVAFKQQYFSSVIIAPGAGISSADVAFTTAAEGSGYMKSFSATMNLPLSAATTEFDLGLYYGPNQYNVLANVSDIEGYEDLRLKELVPLGWGIFGWVNKFIVIPVFNLLRNHIASFGIIILILVIFIKLLISPLTYSSYMSMAKMRVIKPQVDELAAKYPKTEDAAKRQQATMELYNRVGINPMGGCLPMLIQMPILIAMFRFFPASIELRGQSFLWANDLSSYDSVLNLPFNIPFYGDHVSLFALLMTIVMFVYSKQNYNQSASSQPEMAGMKFMMVYMMPVMMLLWFNSYSSGLCYYYFLANLFTILQTYIIRRMVDDEKVLAKLTANSHKNKDKKKSKFQLRYEEMLAEQQRLEREKKGGK
ncbi:MAG: membrane protein insertase YidC [Rikenellaceae bacterium]